MISQSSITRKSCGERFDLSAPVCRGYARAPSEVSRAGGALDDSRRLFWFNVIFVSLLSRFLCSRPRPACYDAGAGGQLCRRERAHMPRRLSFTRLSPMEQPLVFMASFFIFGRL